MSNAQEKASILQLVSEPVAPDIDRPGFRVYDHPVTTSTGNKLRAGVYWHGQRPGKSDAPPAPFDQWVCSPLHVSAVTSCNGAHFGRLLRFRNTLGQWREWAMPMAMLSGSGEDLRRELLSMGVEIDPDGFKQLNRYIQSQHPDRQVTAASTTGWHGTELFIMPGENIGQGDAILQSELANLDDFTRAGNLDGWRDNVARFSAGNPLLILGICTALAGPLLYPTRQQSGGINLHGKSSTGKSSIAQAAASVWGHGEQLLRTWNATGNGLEGIASQRNDTLLALDELGESDPAKVGDIVYALANGTGRARATRTGGARTTNRWRVSLLSSGELTLPAKMAEVGKRSKAGQEVRLLDLSAARRHGCWDHLHGHPDGGSLSKAIKRASVTHYGHAGPAFVRHLLDGEGLDGLPEALTLLRAQYQPRNNLEGRAADRFALLALAGELAIGCGLLPLEPDAARLAMLELFANWQSERSADPSEDAAIKALVLEFITRHGEAHFSELGRDSAPVRDRAGWWREDAGRRTWLLTSEGLRRAVPGFEQRTVLDVLDAAGWLTERGEGGKRAKQVKADGQSQRLYHLQPREA
jgi:putative DNA primase/helicase